MAEYDANICYSIPERKALLDDLGGLPETTVQNTEWLYMLEEDTRQSLSIEGYFATDQELEAVLAGRKTAPEIANYFRAAQAMYDFALQYYRDHIVRLDVPLVRHIHSELFREMDARRGEFRRAGIHIHGAKVQPPEFDVELYVRTALALSVRFLQELPILSALARAHTLFESIHPFSDGNGRVGRILLNYAAISLGYPPIIIKGWTPEERRRYYHALEAADRGFHEGFPDPEPHALEARLHDGNFAPLELLLCEGLLPRLDRIAAIALEQHEPLLDFKELAARLGVKEVTLRLWIHRGKLIAIKRGKKLYSHPRLILPPPRASSRRPPA